MSVVTASRSLARIALVALSAAAVLAIWPSPGRAATWCGTTAPADRTPQAVAGHNVHVVYAIASDGADNSAALAQTVQSDVEGIEAWWRGQDPTRSPRFDLFPFPCAQQLDLSLMRIAATTVQLQQLEGRYESIRNGITASGFDTRYVKYLVYYDGPVDGDVCGQGGGSPQGFGIAIVYARTCTDVPSMATAAHELVHAFGAMSDGSPPHQCPDNRGHICDTAVDLMYPTTLGEQLATLVLDPGRDDYYGHAAAWFDVQDSRWLRRLDAQARLSVQLSGSGTVESDVPGLSCAVTCAVDWNPGTVVALSPTPASGSRFVRWGGACAGLTGCRVELAQAATVTALFAPAAFRLSVARSGRGVVRSRGQEIACPARCAAAVPSYVPLRLVAVPAKGWRFARWSGGCAGTRPTCTVAMTKASAARATFARRPSG